MAECIVGDIAPMDNVSKAEKHRREKEYETQSSPEARLVKQFDLVEMILQAHEYEELEETPGRLQEFFDSTEGRFHHPDVIQLVDCLKEERSGHMSNVAGAMHSRISQDPATDSAEAPPQPQPPTHTS
ncbi:HD domain-containing protein 2 [Merluccius polli]|uniref:HD domain-containing protein 2 n=1 Tax=Merluccius polli TaxID=89951 RepID=A0AA47N5R7_MERPO|nr:HD domain-containing protein 2 [Merluccius polli]